MGTWYWRSWKTLSVVLSFSSCVSFSWIEFTCSCQHVSNRSACQHAVSNWSACQQLVSSQHTRVSSHFSSCVSFSWIEFT